MEQALEGFHARGIRWRAKTLTDRGPGAQESRFGADFAGVVEMDLPEYRVRKGFLSQAKLLERGELLGGTEMERLRRQCGQMLSRTSAAFVFVYSSSDITIIPALAVASSQHGDLHSHYSRSVSRFYEEHFACFFGDRTISAPTPQMLEKLPEQLPAPAILTIRAESDRAIEDSVSAPDRPVLGSRRRLANDR